MSILFSVTDYPILKSLRVRYIHQGHLIAPVGEEAVGGERWCLLEKLCLINLTFGRCHVVKRAETSNYASQICRNKKYIYVNAEQSVNKTWICKIGILKSKKYRTLILSSIHFSLYSIYVIVKKRKKN